jgi:hypothetical protein
MKWLKSINPLIALSLLILFVVGIIFVIAPNKLEIFIICIFIIIIMFLISLVFHPQPPALEESYLIGLDPEQTALAVGELTKLLGGKTFSTHDCIRRGHNTINDTLDSSSHPSIYSYNSGNGITIHTVQTTIAILRNDFSTPKIVIRGNQILIYHPKIYLTIDIDPGSEK